MRSRIYDTARGAEGVASMGPLRTVRSHRRRLDEQMLKPAGVALNGSPAIRNLSDTDAPLALSRTAGLKIIGLHA